MIAGGSYTFQLIANIIRERFPDLRSVTPEEKPGQSPIPNVCKLGNSKIRKDLSIKFRPIEETVVDTVESLRARGRKLE